MNIQKIPEFLGQQLNLSGIATFVNGLQNSRVKLTGKHVNKSDLTLFMIGTCTGMFILAWLIIHAQLIHMTDFYLMLFFAGPVSLIIGPAILNFSNIRKVNECIKAIKTNEENERVITEVVWAYFVNREDCYGNIFIFNQMTTITEGLAKLKVSAKTYSAYFAIVVTMLSLISNRSNLISSEVVQLIKFDKALRLSPVYNDLVKNGGVFTHYRNCVNHLVQRELSQKKIATDLLQAEEMKLKTFLGEI